MTDKFTVEQLKERHSVRSFIDSPLAQPMRETIKAILTMINTHEPGMHFEAFFDNDDPFKGFTRSYGFFKNPKNYIAAVVDTSFPNPYERAGFFSEQIVMNLVSMGLGTCFVGGTFDSKATGVHLKADRKILFVILFGLEDMNIKRPVMNFLQKRMKRNNISAREFFIGTTADYDDALKAVPELNDCLEALDCAPSSLNKRPARLRWVENHLEVYLPEKKDDKQLIDLGIAKFNVQAVLPENKTGILISLPYL